MTSCANPSSPHDPSDPRANVEPASPREQWQIQVFFDGECPLCRREITFLRRRDGGRGRVSFEDITAPGFDATRHGLERKDLTGRIHGVLPDGRIVDGVEVFRRLYDAVGLGWLLAPTRWPLLRPLADAAYRWFARNRLRITGRHEMECVADRCAVPAGRRTPDVQ